MSKIKILVYKNNQFQEILFQKLKVITIFHIKI
jgi:hypothetical protein